MKIVYLLLVLLFTFAAVADDTILIESVDDEWTLFERVSLKLGDINKQQDMQKLDLFKRVHNKLQDEDSEQNFNDVEWGGC